MKDSSKHSNNKKVLLVSGQFLLCKNQCLFVCLWFSVCVCVCVGGGLLTRNLLRVNSAGPIFRERRNSGVAWGVKLAYVTLTHK